MNLQGLFDEFESAAIALESLTLYQSGLEQPDLIVELYRREAARSVVDIANELMNAIDAKMEAVSV